MSLRVISDRVSKFLMVLAAFWAFILTFIIMADVIGRSVFDEPVQGVSEIVANSIVIIVFLQAGYAIRSRSMLCADFLVVHFPVWAQRAVLAFGYLLGAVFFAFIIWGGWQLAIDSWTGGEFEGEGALRVPAWPTRFTILIGSALAIANYLIMAYLDVMRPGVANGTADDKDDFHTGTRQ